MNGIETNNQLKRKYLSIEDIQKEYLPVSKKRIRVFVQKYMPINRIGGRIFVDRDILEALLSDPEREAFPLD